MRGHPSKILGLTLCCILALGASVLAVAWADGGAPDVRGVWNGAACVGGSLAQCKANPQYPSTFTITDVSPGGAVSGTASYGPITGTQSGSTVTLHAAYSGYTSDATYTVNADNTAMDGTFDDSYGRHAEPTFATRVGAPPGTTTTTTTTTTTPTGTPTKVQIFCNYLVATQVDTCFASVADATGQAVTPTGTVRFTTSPSVPFVAGDTCSLTQSGAGVASCSVQLLTPGANFPTVTGDYSGDSQHAPSSGSSQFLFAGPGTNAYVPTIKAFNPPTINASVTNPIAGSTVTSTASVTSDTSENAVCEVGGNAVAGSAFAAATAKRKAKFSIVSARVVQRDARAGKLTQTIRFDTRRLAAAFPKDRRVQVVVVTTIKPKKGRAITVYKRKTLTLHLSAKQRAKARRASGAAARAAAGSATWVGTSRCGTLTFTLRQNGSGYTGYANWSASLACDDGTFVQLPFVDSQPVTKTGTIYEYLAVGNGYTVGVRVTGGAGTGTGGITTLNSSGARCRAETPANLAQTQ